ncbi:MAG TPA: hypothetical protein VGQ57_07065 [Polyangiaceae bacterium]|nr:hypothetical protein [Polyangiaceae bacterium]
MERRARPGSWRPSARSVALGVFSAFVAWLVVLAHLTSTLHFALISHEVCAAHGELVHAQRRAALAHPANGHESAALPGDADPAHDHCPLVGSRHEHATLVAAPDFVTASAPHLAALSAPGVQVHPSRAALLLAAPKQSPPA